MAKREQRLDALRVIPPIAHLKPLGIEDRRETLTRRRDSGVAIGRARWRVAGEPRIGDRELARRIGAAEQQVATMLPSSWPGFHASRTAGT